MGAPPFTVFRARRILTMNPALPEATHVAVERLLLTTLRGMAGVEGPPSTAKVTDPLGLSPTTFAVKVTNCRNSEGFALEVTVTLAAALIVWDMVPELAA